VSGRFSRALVLAGPWTWLVAFLVAPAAILLAIALAEPRDGVPPYTPLIEWSGEGGPRVHAVADNFALLVQDVDYGRALLLSLRVAGISTLFCLLIGYPMALAIARAPPWRRSLLLLLVILPFWTGFLLRINAWIGLLKDDGWINAGLLALGLIGAPLRLLYTDFAMYVGVVYAYLPFLVLPLYARLSRIDASLLEAAADLGATPWRAFLAVTLPLSMPGVWAGVALVFIPAMGEYVIPELLGGPRAQTIGRVVWTEFFQNRDWPQAAALAVTLLVVLMLPAALVQRRQDRAE
jgi:putrescine transport system permease protein